MTLAPLGLAIVKQFLDAGALTVVGSTGFCLEMATFETTVVMLVLFARAIRFC